MDILVGVLIAAGMLAMVGLMVKQTFDGTIGQQEDGYVVTPFFWEKDDFEDDE
jgi:hypothetical protein